MMTVIIITFRAGVAHTLGAFANSFAVARFLRLRILALDEGDHGDNDYMAMVMMMMIMMAMRRAMIIRMITNLWMVLISVFQTRALIMM